MGQVSQVGIDLVKAFEGFSATAYLCPAGVWTIGYGSIKGVKKGDVITLADAEKLLVTELEEHWHAAAGAVKVPLNQWQTDALASFVFNLGVGAFRNSTLLKRLNEGASNADIEAQIRRWAKARVNGVMKELPGLVTRRNAEAMLYSAPANAQVSVRGQQVIIAPPAPAPTPADPTPKPPPPTTSPAPERPIQPGDMPQRPTTGAGKPAATSPTIWSGIVAFFAGVAALLGHLFDGVRGVWEGWKTQLGFNPIWILFAIFTLAMIVVIVSRINDRKKIAD
jgi:lysozyme